MKILYTAYTEVTVFGTSWNSADGAKRNAIGWWTGEKEEPADWNDIKIAEIETPDDATDQDFIHCAQLHEYEETAEHLRVYP